MRRPRLHFRIGAGGVLLLAALCFILTLDELVFGAPPPSARDSAVRCLEALGFYSRLPKNRQQLLKQHVLSILELLEEN